QLTRKITIWLQSIVRRCGYMHVADRNDHPRPPHRNPPPVSFFDRFRRSDVPATDEAADPGQEAHEAHDVTDQPGAEAATTEMDAAPTETDAAPTDTDVADDPALADQADGDAEGEGRKSVV